MGGVKTRVLPVLGTLPNIKIGMEKNRGQTVHSTVQKRNENKGFYMEVLELGLGVGAKQTDR